MHIQLGLKSILGVIFWGFISLNVFAQGQGCITVQSPKDVTVFCAQLGINTSPSLSQTGDLELDGLTPSFPGAVDGSVLDFLNFKLRSIKVM